MTKAGVLIVLGAAAMVAGSTGLAAEAAIQPASGAVLDGNSLWRYFSVSSCSHVRTVEGKLEPRDINWYWGAIKAAPVATNTPSPMPPAGWADPAFDDAHWPRVRLPQPLLTVSGANPRPFYLPYATTMLVLRGKFTLDDPAQVQACSLSLNYFGGAIVYVNGKEAARGHVPTGKSGLDAVAEDYPVEAFTTTEGKPLRPGDTKHQDRLALRERKLSDVKIPATVLRKGVNILAVEIHAAPVHEKGIVPSDPHAGWPPIGMLDASLTISTSAGALGPARPKAIHLWNCAAHETLTAFDYGDPAEPLGPVTVRAARNGVFSGRLAIRSEAPLKGLKVTVTDLTGADGGKIPAAAVRVRYAEPAVVGKSWAPTYRFDGLLDAIPAEIPVVSCAPPRENFYGKAYDRKGLAPGAVASLWLTLRVPGDAKPGAYQGSATVTADGLQATVPIKVSVSDWTVPDPKDFRIQNFGYLSDDAVAKHYGVDRWSSKHFDLMAKSFALMAEVNSRQVFANMTINFYGGNKGGADSSNEESLVRWIRKKGSGVSVQVSGEEKTDAAQPSDTRHLTPDSYSYDFTIFDKYLDMVAKVVGKPQPLRLNCWTSWSRKGEVGEWSPAGGVTLLDPASGKTERLAQPAADSPEFVAFWKPVLDEARKRIAARGWIEVTSIGHNSYCYAPHAAVVDACHRIWPEAVWSYTAHNGTLGGRFGGSDKSVSLPVRYADTVWGAGRLTARGYTALLKPRPGFWCFTYRGCFRDGSPLTDLRRIDEDEAMMGHDGISDFGVDLFPLKAPNGRVYGIANGRGTGGPGDSTMAVLAPGPDGAVATERFEMLREGVELAEAILFIQRALDAKKLSDDLAQRANRYLDERGTAFMKGWFGVRYMQAEQDEKLLGIAGEVARATGL